MKLVSEIRFVFPRPAPSHLEAMTSKRNALPQAAPFSSAAKRLTPRLREKLAGREELEDLPLRRHYDETDKHGRQAAHDPPLPMFHARAGEKSRAPSRIFVTAGTKYGRPPGSASPYMGVFAPAETADIAIQNKRRLLRSSARLLLQRIARVTSAVLFRVRVDLLLSALRREVRVHSWAHLPPVKPSTCIFRSNDACCNLQRACFKSATHQPRDLVGPLSGTDRPVSISMTPSCL